MKSIVFGFIVIIFLFQDYYPQSLNNELGIPHIKNYNPKEYAGHSQNWDILQDNRGIMYFANGFGVLEYDGVSWRLIQTDNKIITRSLAKDNSGKIYVGGSETFGYLAPDSIGQLKYISLVDQVDEQYRDFFDVWKTVFAENKVIFTTRKYLFLWDGSQMSTIPAETSYHTLFFANGEFYVRQRQIGLMRLSGNELKLIPGSDFIASTGLYSILPFDSVRILVITKKGLYLYDGIEFKEFITAVDEELTTSQMYHASMLPDGNIAIATFYSGLFIIDKKGNLISRLDKSSGMLDDYILSTFVDKQGGLWLGLGNGICRIDIPSPITLFNDLNGASGIIQNFLRFNNNLHFTSSIGLSKLDYDNQSTKNVFNPLQLDPGSMINESWDIISSHNSMLIATKKGIYQFKNNRSYRLSNLYTFSLCRSLKDTNRVFAGLDDGLKSIYYSNGRWKDDGLIEGVNGEVRSIVEDSEGFLWLATFSNGVYRIKISDYQDLEISDIKHYDLLHGLQSLNNIELSKVSGQIYFLTEKGIKKFDDKLNMFVAEDRFGNVFSDSTTHVYRFAEDNDKNIWSIIVDNSEIKIVLNEFNRDGTYSIIEKPFSRFRGFTAHAIYPENNGVVWYGGPDGVVRFDSKIIKNVDIEFDAVIRGTIVNTDSIIFAGYKSVNIDPPILEYTNNQIRFEYSAPSFDEEEENLYQYLLDGFDDTWSDWNIESKKDYTNLPEGQYTFRVKTKNIYNNISNEGSFEFIILPPWYRTWLSYCIYTIILGFSLWALIKWRIRKIEMEKENLERIVAERTAELASEKEKADKLLYNILPVEVAEELKEKGETTPHKYDDISILFTDFRGFTTTVSTMPAKKITDELNDMFEAFDDIIDEHGLEKIKTIGDAYMVASGLPREIDNHAVVCVKAAKEMLDFIEERNIKSAIKWEMRVGIHSGSVVAGVVGKRKFTYDVWGDTVNIASRMESSGEPGRINVSAFTYDLIKDFFECEYRGKITAKGKGDIDMYFVAG